MKYEPDKGRRNQRKLEFLVAMESGRGRMSGVNKLTWLLFDDFVLSYLYKIQTAFN